MILVLVVITVLGLLAGSFAFAMKVEIKLARNASYETELEWLGRSGVELARYVLGESRRGGQPFSSLNQIWAGGPGVGNETNGPLAIITLQNNRLGMGTFSVEIRDLERKFNINRAEPELLKRALAVMEVDAADAAVVVDSILDWRDPDNDPRPSGTESEFYRGLEPPYRAKNGPFDDLAELLLVRGVTPELYWGPRVAEHRSQLFEPTARRGRRRESPPTFPMGLVDLFTTLSAGPININTAPPCVLQLLPGVDANAANNIVRARAGLDGVEKTDDDTPFTSPAMLNPAVVPGLDPQVGAMAGRFAGVISTTYEVTVLAQISRYQRRFYAILRCNSPNDVPILQFSWR